MTEEELEKRREVVSGITDTGEEMKYLVENGFRNPDLSPGICINCGEMENYHERVIDSIDHCTTESIALCRECGNRVGYWAFGHWEIT